MARQITPKKTIQPPRPANTAARLWLRSHKLTLGIVGLFAVLVTSLLLYRIATLPSGGLSGFELQIAATPTSWHSLIQDPFFLSAKVLHSAGFYLLGSHGALSSRLPSALLGAVAIISVGLLLRAWHGARIAVLGCLLFATSAWTLHISRFAGFDSSYLVALPLLLATQLIIQRSRAGWVPYIILLVWSSLLFTPGLIWFVLIAVWWQRYELHDAWRQGRTWWRRTLLVLSGLVWLPLLANRFITQPLAIKDWIGMPTGLSGLSGFGQRLADVPLHLFIHGPSAPDIWLGQLPILDVFTLIVTILGIVFYTRHWRSSRAHQIGIYGLLSFLLIGLGGSVTLSLVIPLLYLLAGSGLSWLLRDWLTRFPNNPIARAVGIALITTAVVTSCVYNLQSYFVAWPHSSTTISHFMYQI